MKYIITAEKKQYLTDGICDCIFPEITVIAELKDSELVEQYVTYYKLHNKDVEVTVHEVQTDEDVIQLLRHNN